MLIGPMRRFQRDERGVVAIIYALAMMPLLMFAGSVIDYSRAQQTKARLQIAIDGIALKLGKLNLNVDLTAYAGPAQTQVEQIMTGTTARNITVTITRPGDGAVRVDGVADTPTTLTNLFGFTKLTTRATSVVSRGVGNLEIALVLDNTGSMTQNSKLSRLKTAATNMVDTLASQTDPSKPNALKFAVVPFSMTVNVGSTYANATWMDTGAKASYHDDLFNQSGTNRFTMFNNLGIGWGGCVEMRPAPYDVDGSEPTAGTPDTLYVPYFAPDESDTDTSGWENDYLKDYQSGTPWPTPSWKTRQGNQGKYKNPVWQSNTRGYRIGNSGYLYGPNSGCEIAPIQRLTTSTSTVKTAINNMVASGDTNIAIGLAWGWNTLSPGYPFKDGIAYGTKDYTKIVVLMTDGQQQNLEVGSYNDSLYSGIGYIWQNRIGLGSGSSTPQRTVALDNRLSTLCSNMKAKGILIYTIRVEVTDGTSDLLQNCATNPSMFYNVSDSSGLTATFTAIGQSISQLSISK
jgi:Flp pilus assembly protein TadG